MRAIRCALSGYNALTDTDPRHFSLYTDAENILIKEHSRGSIQVDNGNWGEITHSLGYKPHVYIYGETSTNGRFKLVHGYDVNIDYRMYLDTSKVYVYNNTGTNDREVRYYIFYDEAVS